MELLDCSRLFLLCVRLCALWGCAICDNTANGNIRGNMKITEINGQLLASDVDDQRFTDLLVSLKRPLILGFMRPNGQAVRAAGTSSQEVDLDAQGGLRDSEIGQSITDL